MVEEQEDTVKAGKSKTVESVDSLSLDEDHEAVTNKQGSSLLQSLQSLTEEVKVELKSLKAMEQSYLDVRQRTFCTWVRDAHGGSQGRQREDIRRLNYLEEIVHAGDVRMDAILVTSRFSSGSTERWKFPDLYGLPAETVKELDQAKCYRSLQALDCAASTLMAESKHQIQEDWGKDRDELVDEGKFEEAEKKSETVAWI